MEADSLVPGMCPGQGYAAARSASRIRRGAGQNTGSRQDNGSRAAEEGRLLVAHFKRENWSWSCQTGVQRGKEQGGGTGMFSCSLLRKEARARKSSSGKAKELRKQAFFFINVFLAHRSLIVS